VKGSHIVVPRVHDQGHAYILQNPDKRVIFIIPFEGRFSLIGTTDVAVGSIDEGHQISQAEVTYLLQSANRYLANSINENDIVWSYAGVRPLYDDGARNPSEITRDYVLKLDHESGRLPLLSVFGGKITTYRRLAEHALADLSRFYDHMHHPWTANEPLPGGDIESTGEEVHEVTKSYRELPIDYLTQLVCRYGSRVRSVLGKTCRFSDLGASFGAGANMLCEREIDYLIREEWARHPADILWRRTKTGLHMTVAERAEAESFIGDRLKEIAR
jgi:glycerol-3-phosphate dehydrogenase